jgi:hypothetical protein
MVANLKAPTPEQVAEFEKTLASRAPARQVRDKLIAEDDARWEREVATLQSRVYSAFVDVDIGGGDKIAVRTSLLDEEVKRMGQLENQRDTEKDPTKQEEISCEMIEIITANPLITKDWLLTNKDKYSPSDLLSIILGYMEVRLRERAERIAGLRSAALFRPNEEGPSLRSLSIATRD